MDARLGWVLTMIAASLVSGCKTPIAERSGGSRLLTGAEMDEVTAGSAVAINKVEADGSGVAPQTTTASYTLANSGGTLMAGIAVLNSATAQASASARNGLSVRASGSTRIAVDGAGGGASLDAGVASTAAGSGTSQAQVNMQFTGISIGRVDLVYGTASAAACCAPFLATEVNTGGGPYSIKLEAFPRSTTPGEVRDRVDIAVASSTLPILSAGAASAVSALSLSQHIAQ